MFKRTYPRRRNNIARASELHAFDSPDDPIGVMQHADRFHGGKALVVLGGSSAVDWDSVRDEICPDVIIGGNGVNAMVPNLDYWICAENMNYSKMLAEQGDARYKEFWNMFERDSGAKIKLISHWSWHLLRDKSNCICIRREGYEKGQIPPDFSFRSYGKGLLNGWVFRKPRAGRLIRVGTVAAQALHFAGILGVKEIHTIGLDLMFRSTQHHHAYPYPIYKVDRWRKPGMFITYKGIQTQEVWVDTARFFADVEPFVERDGIMWKDHSNGLLKIEGLRCAT
jgi:hypothetical protein